MENSMKIPQKIKNRTIMIQQFHIWEYVQRKWKVVYVMEYYSAIKKKEILPFVTTWMDLEDIMLSEISRQRKTNTV